jgi:hypothetical protein
MLIIFGQNLLQKKTTVAYYTLKHNFKINTMKSKKILLALALFINVLSFGQTNTFPATGNVGIGITNPKYKLDILTPVTGTETETYSGIQLHADHFGYIIEGGIKQKAGGTLKFSLNQGGTISEKFRIDSYGNVGIGTNNPTAKLDVNGDMKISGLLNLIGNNALHFSTFGGGFYMNDDSWLRTLGNKNFYHNTGIMRTDGVFHVGPNGNRLVVNELGNVGIGTSTPSAKLDVNGNGHFKVADDRSVVGALTIETNNGTNLKLGGNTTYSWIQSHNSKPLYINELGNNTIFNLGGGNVGIGTSDPVAKLTVKASPDGYPTPLKAISIWGPNSPADSNSARDLSWDFAAAGSASIRSYRGGSWDTYMQFLTSNVIGGNNPQIRMHINHDGNVGIGTTAPDQKLTVKGKIHAEEIIVDLNVPADYVFQKYYTGTSALKSDYVMPTLAEIENFTKKNHHLPNVPSAAAIQENGLSLGEMSNILLQKIEELTLYAIEQDKKAALQQQELDRLKTENENYKSLAERLSAIEKELKK